MFGILLAEAADEVTQVSLGTQNRIIELWTSSDLLIKFTLVLTICFSVASWAVIGFKYKQLKRVRKRSDQFISLFWQSRTIEALIQKGSFLKSPVFQIFKAGIAALREDGTKDRISYEIRKAADNEIEELERYIPLLATTANIAPFLGLFGTIWGVLKAFWDLGHTAGATSLEVVGPHIGEALGTTAVGLIAAIPAATFYNYFVVRIRAMSRDLNQFAGDLLNRIEDEYLRRG